MLPRISPFLTTLSPVLNVNYQKLPFDAHHIIARPNSPSGVVANPHIRVGCIADLHGRFEYISPGLSDDVSVAEGSEGKVYRERAFPPEIASVECPIDLLLYAGDIVNGYPAFFPDDSGIEAFKRDNLETQLVAFNDAIGSLYDRGLVRRGCCVVIGGNHDFIRSWDIEHKRRLLSNCVYLEEEVGVVRVGVTDENEIDKMMCCREDEELESTGNYSWTHVLKIWGSPYSLTLSRWRMPEWSIPHYFGTRDREFLDRKWDANDAIPRNVDILLSHTPPYGIMDLAGGVDDDTPCAFCFFPGSDSDEAPIRRHANFEHRGSKGLAKIADELSREGNLKLCVFGHMHEDFGTVVNRQTGMTFVNASFDERNVGKNRHQAVIVECPLRKIDEA